MATAASAEAWLRGRRATGEQSARRRQFNFLLALLRLSAPADCPFCHAGHRAHEAPPCPPYRQLVKSLAEEWQVRAH